MGRGGSKATQRYKGGGNLNPNNVKNRRDLIGQRGKMENEVDSVLNVGKNVKEEYGDQIGNYQLADIGGKDANTLAFYDGSNIVMNSKYFNEKAMNSAYDDSVKSGFHPSRGKKSGLEAVAAHEFGHELTDSVAKKIGAKSLDEAATTIVNEARKNTKHKGVVQMAAKISKYATASNAEAIAEAYADTYCNGKKAKAESKAIMKVVNNYLK